MVVRSRLYPVALVAAAVVIGGTACSSPAPKKPAGQPDVATLRSAGPVTPSPSPSAAQPPRERIDGTAADFEVLVKPYRECMTRHGLGEKGQRLSDSAMPNRKVADAAEKDCKPLYPLPPWELDPANPKAKDFARDVVTCLKHKGVRYVEVNPDGPGWSLGGPQNDQKSISKGMDLSPACEREFAAKNT